MPTPQIPNTFSAIASGETSQGDEVMTRLTPPWIQAFVALFGYTNVVGTVTMYAGTAAPTGWTKITTAGLPSIPAGFIWIQKN
jgi:hypothetical protein